MAFAATRFERVSPSIARLVLAAYAAIALIVLCFSFPMVGTEKAPDKQGDLETYQQVVDALKDGVPYYEALHTELVSAGYGTHSVFNWRPPFFLTALALSPSTMVSQAVLVAIAAAALTLALGLQWSGPAMRVGLALLLVLSLVSVIVPGAQNMCELYAGALILLSVAAYGRGWHWMGFGAATLALLFRELSIAYVVLCVWFALRERRWTEVGAWGVVLLAFTGYFAWHAQLAMSMVGPLDKAYPEGWVQFGGLSFDLITANFNGAFLLMPFWVTGLLLPLAVLGLLAWPAKAGQLVLATVLTYLAMFAIVGKPMNIYWGAIYTPLLALGVVWAAPALRDLVLVALPGKRVAA
ncbi:MAG: hypothetical protein ABIQ30_03210 [Devosia sp.]